MDANDRKRLNEAVQAGIIGPGQAERLLEFFVQERERPRFTPVHVLYYLGGMIAIGAMSLFMTLGWKSLGGWGGFVTALCYLVLFSRSRTGCSNAGSSRSRPESWPRWRW